MHKFASYPSASASPPDLRGAYLVGAEGAPIRGELRQELSITICETRYQEALGLSLLWPVRGYGVVQLETTRLPARDEPYHLPVELARHRLMRISMKQEEWGLFDYPGMEEITHHIEMSRDLFIGALQKLADDPVAAARLADEALSIAMNASEEMTRFHANVFLGRRQQAGGFSKPFVGATLPPSQGAPKAAAVALPLLGFVRVPFVWRDIQPKENGVQFDALDAIHKVATKAGIGVRGGPLLNFGVQFVPDWMYIWENDYEAIADFAREHVRRTVMRYASKTEAWIVASGLHADSVFSFTFEQIMDLTRMAASVTKQCAPRAQVVLDLIQPWGEYHARNQRTIPPLLYAEMAVQSGVPFDAFGLQFLYGMDSEGYQMRDLLQISSLLDRIANLGKALHVTAVCVPSKPAKGGQWHGEWSEALQAEWLNAFVEVAMSKPFVESVCLANLVDGGGVPNTGVLRESLTIKPAFERLVALRNRLTGGSRS